MARKTSPSHTNLILLFYGAITVATAVLLWVFVNTSLHTYRAAVANGVNVSITPKTATLQPNTNQTATVSIKPTTATNTMTAFNIVLKASGNTQFVSASTPDGFDDTKKLFHTVSADTIRLAYIVYLSDPLTEITFDVTFKGAAGAGGISVSQPELEVTGNVENYVFVPDQLDTAAYTFGGGGGGGDPTATPAFTVAPTQPPTGGTQCGDACATQNDCPTSNSCLNSTCVLTACATGANCTPDKCALIDPTAGPDPTNAPNPTSTPAPTKTPMPTPTRTPTPTPTPTRTPTPTPTKTPTPTPTFTPTPTPLQPKQMTLKITAKLQGITTEPFDTRAESVTVKLEGLTAVSATATLAPTSQGLYTGSVSINAIPANTYTVLVKGAHHLQKKICINRPSEATIGEYSCEKGQVTLAAGDNALDLQSITLLAGDLPTQDGVIDSADLAAIRQRIGSQTEEDLLMADINHDGIVDTQDFSLALYSIAYKFDAE